MTGRSRGTATLSPAQQRAFQDALRAAGIGLLDHLRIESRQRLPLEPVSFSQERLWLLNQIDPGSAAYNLSAAIRFGADLSIPALQKALKALIRRHEILRTTIELDPSCGEPKQRVHHDVPVHLATVDARAFTTDEWDRHFRAEANRPFDLATGPDDESRPLLEYLYGVAAREDHTCRFRWEVGRSRLPG